MFARFPAGGAPPLQVTYLPDLMLEVTGSDLEALVAMESLAMDLASGDLDHVLETQSGGGDNGGHVGSRSGGDRFGGGEAAAAGSDDEQAGGAEVGAAPPVHPRRTTRRVESSCRAGTPARTCALGGGRHAAHRGDPFRLFGRVTQRRDPAAAHRLRNHCCFSWHFNEHFSPEVLLHVLTSGLPSYRG